MLLNAFQIYLWLFCSAKHRSLLAGASQATAAVLELPTAAAAVTAATPTPPACSSRSSGSGVHVTLGGAADAAWGAAVNDAGGGDVMRSGSRATKSTGDDNNDSHNGVTDDNITDDNVTDDNVTDGSEAQEELLTHGGDGEDWMLAELDDNDNNSDNDKDTAAAVQEDKAAEITKAAAAAATTDAREAAAAARRGARLREQQLAWCGLPWHVLGTLQAVHVCCHVTVSHSYNDTCIVMA